MIDLSKSEKYTRLASLGMGPYVMKKLKVCPICGHIAGPWTFICPVCQNRLPAKTLFDFYKKLHAACPHCKTTLAEDARYCPHCGRKVQSKSSKTQLR